MPNAVSRTYLLRRHTAFILGAALSLAAAVAWLGAGLTAQLAQLELSWRADHGHIAGVAEALWRIEHHLGYGGFSQNFANYADSRDRARLTSMARELHAVSAAIGDYRPLIRSPRERGALAVLQGVVEEYAALLARLRSPEAGEAEFAALARAVREEQAPVAAALRTLAGAVDAYNAGVVAEADRNVRDIRQRLSLGLLLIPGVMLMGVMLLWFMRQATRAHASAEQAQRYMLDLIEAAPDPLLIVDQQGVIRRANFEAERMFGYRRDEMQGKVVEMLLPHGHRARHRLQRLDAFARTRVRPMKSHGEFTAYTKDGVEIPVEIGISYSVQPDGVQAITIIRDVRERRRSEERLRLLQKVYDDMAEAILITDERQRIIEANDAFCMLSGYGREELIGQSPKMLTSGRHDAAFYRDMWHSVQTRGYWQGEVWDRNKEGEVFPIRLGLSAVSEPGGRISHYVGVFADITAIKANEERLEQLAHFDHLTGLANRLVFHDRIRTLIARSSRSHHRFMLLYLDLDGFKLINDRLGHQAGDEVLIAVAERLRAALREEDAIARLGGDEFGVLVADLRNERQAKVVADKVLAALTWQLEVEGGALPLSASIGMAIYPDDGDDEAALIRQADQAMYRAKRDGKHTWRSVSATLR